VTVKRREVFSEVGEIEDPVNVAKQVILRDYLFEIERVKQLVLRLVVASHHPGSLQQSTRRNYLTDALQDGVFQQNRSISAVQLNTSSAAALERKGDIFGAGF
jgi:hypothetical protein